MVKDLDQCYRDGVRHHFQKLQVHVPAPQFGKDQPRLATAATADLRQRMERSGPRLGEMLKGLLGWGVKTGLNEAFIIDEPTRDRLISETPAAAEIIKPLLAGDDVRRYEVHSRGTCLIYAYHGIDIRRYPSVENHLKPFRSFKDGQGKTVGLDHRATQQEWFELQQPQMAYRGFFDGEKIVYPEIGKEARFVLETNGLYLNNKCFFLPSADWFLLGVLNSASVFGYLKEVCALLGDKDSGGRLEYRAQYLENLPIPDASAADRGLIGELARRAQGLHGRRRERSEAFLRGLGLDPAGSTSRNPLEQPWVLGVEEYGKRARKLLGRAPDMKWHEAARDETAALTEEIARVEAEIDVRVAALYGLDAEDRRWAVQSAGAARPDAKQTLFFELLAGLKAGRSHFSLAEVQAAVNEAELSLTDETLRVYLSEATKKGLIHDAGRGWYSRLSKPLELDARPVQKLVRATRKALPLLEFCAWSTVQVNPWLTHLLAQPVAFLYVPRETLESVGETLRAEGWDVWVNPGKNAAHEIRPGERAVVLRPAHSKQPPARDHVAAAEQVWVELVIEAEALALMDEAEARAAWRLATESGLLQMSDMKRFAESRYLRWAEICPINQRHIAQEKGIG